MITISNQSGWMSNTISYSRISRIANSALITARLELSETEYIDHSRDMPLSEKFFDYVFCGSVKKEYMDYLFMMIRQRKDIVQIQDNSGSRSAVDGAESIGTGNAGLARSRQRPTKFTLTLFQQPARRIERELHIERFTPEMTMDFGSNPFGKEHDEENYLIFRDHLRRAAVGIPLKLRPTAAERMEAYISSLSQPRFRAPIDIQMQHLENIKATGKLTVGEQIYDVRFGTDNEPIVMFKEDDQQFGAVQRRLHNLSVINHIRRKLAAVESHPFSIDDTDGWNSAHYLQLPDRIREKFANAVYRAYADWEYRKQSIQDSLLEFEHNPHLNAQDAEAFRTLQKSIDLYRYASQKIRQDVEYLSEQMFSIWDSLPKQDSEMCNILEDRMLNIAEQLTAFMPLTKTRYQIREIEVFCYDQMEFITALKRGKFFRTFDPRRYFLDDLPAGRPLEVEVRDRKVLFAKFSKPSVAWGDMQVYMDGVIFSRDGYAVRKERDAIALELSEFLDTLIDDGQGKQIKRRHANFSPQYLDSVQFLEQLIQRLQNTRIYVSKSHLDDIIQDKNAHFEMMLRESARSTQATVALLS